MVDLKQEEEEELGDQQQQEEEDDVVMQDQPGEYKEEPERPEERWEQEDRMEEDDESMQRPDWRRRRRAQRGSPAASGCREDEAGWVEGRGENREAAADAGRDIGWTPISPSPPGPSTDQQSRSSSRGTTRRAGRGRG